MSATPPKQYARPFDLTIKPDATYTADIATSKGTFSVELFAADAPNTVNNFVNLAQDGFYDGTPFHRIIAGFMFQGGDPTGTGAGGPGYRFRDEMGRDYPHDYEKGTLAMANAGPNTNGSQFFVCLSDLRSRLPKNYTIFGKVTSGMEVVDALGAVKTGGGGENSKPLEPVTLESVTVHEG